MRRIAAYIIVIPLLGLLGVLGVFLVFLLFVVVVLFISMPRTDQILMASAVIAAGVWSRLERKRWERPRLVEYLFWFHPSETREAILGDLEEEHDARSAKFGRWHARLWYLKQVFISLQPLVQAAIERLVKWGLARLGR